jgi:hypothetical protein
MDIRAQLLQEHSRRNAEAIATHVGDDPERFAVLMRCMLEDDPRVGQRAAQSVGMVCARYPQLATPYVERLLDALDAPVREAVQRNSVRTLQYSALPARLHGRITNRMFDLIADPSRAIAQRAFAITVAGRMVERYPELTDEFRVLLERVSLEGASAGIRSRVAKALRTLGRRSGTHRVHSGQDEQR